MTPLDKNAMSGADAPESKEQQPKPAKKGMFSSAGLAVLVFVVILEGVVLYFLFNYFVNNPANTGSTKETNPEDPAFHELSEIQAVLQMDSTGRTTGSFRVVPVLELEGDKKAQTATKELVVKWNPKIIDNIRSEMSKISYDRARRPEEADILKRKIKDIVEGIIGKNRVKEVSFLMYLPP